MRLIIFSYIFIPYFVIAGEVQLVEINQSKLLQLSDDMHLQHQGVLAGVPNHYDWKNGPRIEPPEKIDPYGASIATGRALWNEETGYNPNLKLQIRKMQYFVCYGPEKKWMRLQKGYVSGAEFRADFKDNKAWKADANYWAPDGVSVHFKYEHTYHFWPAVGRSPLPEGKIHGVLTVMQARVVTSKDQEIPRYHENNILLGAGADAWKALDSKWDYFQSHTDLGVGRTKYVSGIWEWYGFTSASKEDLKLLFREGFTDQVR